MLRFSNLGRVLLYFSASLSICLVVAPRIDPQPQEKSSGQLNLQVIVVDSSDKARQIRERLLNGEDFTAVAKKESIDPGGTAGKYLGLMAVTTIYPERSEGNWNAFSRKWRGRRDSNSRPLP